MTFEMALLHDSMWWEAARTGSAWSEILSLFNFDKDEKEPDIRSIVGQTVPTKLKLVRGTARLLLRYINIERATREERTILSAEYDAAADFYVNALQHLDQRLYRLGSSSDMKIQAECSKLMEVRWRWRYKLEELQYHAVR